MKQFLSALGSGDTETLANILSDDAAAVRTGISILSSTRDRAAIMETASAFPQLTVGGLDFTILSMTEKDDRLACEVTGEGELINDSRYFNEYHFLFRFRDRVLAPLLAK